MREISIDRTSWHYWFASLGDGANTSDFCAYCRSVFGGMMTCLFLAFVIAFLSAIAGSVLGWFLAGIMGSFTMPLDAALGGVALLSIAGIVCAVYLPAKRLKAIAQENEFVHTAYTSMKEKICFKVRVR